MKRSGTGRNTLVVAVLLVLALVGAAAAGPAPAFKGPIQTGVRAANGTWSSGWLDISPGQALTLAHNYGGDPDAYAVDVWCRDTDGPLGVNQKAFGGMEAAGRLSGVLWQKLTSSSIEILRFADDIDADQVLVRIWIPDSPAWDSGWVDLAPNQTITLNHNVGGDPELYTVGMRFKDTDIAGIGTHLRAAGGLEIGGKVYGAAWQMLTATSIQVLRFADDTAADQVRIQIYQPDPPIWDSGWQSVPAGQEVTLRHGLGGNPITYVVRAFTKDTRLDGRGLNGLYGGGFEIGELYFGSSWEKLTNTSVTIFRFPNDAVAHSSDEVRIWIYAPRILLYLPTVLRAF
jgi:hypothetical protein